jgi:hypothetical protein
MKRNLFTITSIIILSQQLYAADINNFSNTQITIELDFISSQVKPGDKPITLNKSLLDKLLPEVKNPRLMTFADLADAEEQSGFLEGGYTFVLRGDFNKDGIADIAFVGKYKNSESYEENSFVAIISIKGKKVVRDYFLKLNNPKICLISIPDYKPGTDAIGMVFNIFSEECGYLFWNIKQYEFKPCQSVFE